MGDFLQFSPIINNHYFQLTSNQFLHSQIQHNKKIIGKSIRENYIHPNNIILTQHM
jgi:hypothetical protein